eukprot:g32999.t1
MGAIPHENGVAFRVWAPHADRVCVAGDFNDWDQNATELISEGNGFWACEVEVASIGDEYKYVVTNGERRFWRIDPYAREVTNSVGNSVVHDPAFDWEGDEFVLYPWNEIVLYEMHVGTFNRLGDETPGDLVTATDRLGYLKKLGINVIQLMPTAEFAGDWSWGYNPAHIFAVESAYGGPKALKEFVKAAHQEGIGVLLDVVYNHFGPSDLDLWQFDGWSENSKGGIYFYNDWRSQTPWGDTRPDYGRGEVRQFIRDNAFMWLDEYHMDGLRYDMTLYMRSVNGNGECEIPDGWSLTQWINRDVLAHHPRHLTIAEDLQNNPDLTSPEEAGGANFGAQWDAGFVHPVRDVLRQVDDANRSMPVLRDALCHRYNHDSFQRVIYTESHDEVANGKTRLPSEINPGDTDSWESQKRSTLGACLVLTAPGIPMLLQGQEFLWEAYFDDGDPLDWNQRDEFAGIVRFYQDLIRMRRNLDGFTAGLTGQNIDVHHVNDSEKVIAFRRWKEGGPGDETLVVCNVSCNQYQGYRVGVAQAGLWTLRFNGDWDGYSDEFRGKLKMKLFDIAKNAVKDFNKDDCMVSGASLAYYTIFSLPPLLMIVFSVAGWFGVSDQKIDTMIRDQIGIPIENVERQPSESDTDQESEAVAAMGWVTKVIGILILVFSATGLFAQFQQALNRAWEVEPAPDKSGLVDFAVKRVLSLGMVAVVAFLLLVSLVATTLVDEVVRWIQGSEPGAVMTAVTMAIHIVLTLAMVTVLFALMFKFLPDAVIRWKDVWAGAAMTAVLFVIGKTAIGWYLQNSQAGSQWGGAATSIVGVLIWVYYSSLIVLFGAELTQAWCREYGTGIQPAEGAIRTDHPLLKATRIAALVFVVATVFVAVIAALVVAVNVFLLIFLGVLFAVFLTKTSQLLADRSPLSYGWSLASILTTLFLATVGLFFLFGAQIANQLDRAEEELQGAVEKVREQLQKYPRVRSVVQSTPILNDVLAEEEPGSQTTQDSSKNEKTKQPASQQAVKQVAGKLAAVGRRVFATTLGLLVNTAVILFVGIFLAADTRVYRAGVIRLFAKDHRDRVATILDEIGKTLWAWLLGRFLAMAVTGIGTGLALWALGVPLAFTLGALTALLTFVPNIGAAIALTLAVLVALPTGVPTAIGVVVVYLLLQVVESNVLTPLIQQHQVNLPAAFLISFQLLMGALTGFLGVMVATPLLAAVVVVVQRAYVEDVLGDDIAQNE